MEDIAQSLSEATSVEERASLLSSIYLVLPELTQEEPEWLDAFERVSVSPKEQDITYLLDVLENARPGYLIRASDSGERLPVNVRSGDEGGIRISPHYLRRSFTNISDQFYAYIGLANGQLNNQSRYYSVPVEFVRELWPSDPSGLGLPDHLGPHESWPFIASSLGYAGTPGPYWFLVRRTDDLGQLMAQIDRAVQVGPSFLRDRFSEFSAGVDAIRSGSPVSDQMQFASSLRELDRTARMHRAGLSKVVARNRGTHRQLSEALSNQVCLVSESQVPAGTLINKLIGPDSDGVDLRVKQYWMTKLCEVATAEGDVGALLGVLGSDDIAVSNTAARKAVRLIDFLTYGPPISEGPDPVAVAGRPG